MARTKLYKSEMSEAVHESMSDLADAGMIDKKTMRKFDRMCLAKPPALSPDEIRAIREKAAVSQPIFAWHLNVSSNLVSDWERGVKRPGGPALRLLAIVKAKGLDAIV
jgi:putative transcriptional regulator